MAKKKAASGESKSMARLHVNVTTCVRDVLLVMEAKGSDHAVPLGPMVEQMIRDDDGFQKAAKKAKIKLIPRPTPGRPFNVEDL